MRGATHNESLGAEVVNRFLGDVRQDLETNRGARKYVDVTREGIPRFPGDPEIGDDGEEYEPTEGEASDHEPEAENLPPAPPTSNVNLGLKWTLPTPHPSIRFRPGSPPEL